MVTGSNLLGVSAQATVEPGIPMYAEMLGRKVWIVIGGEGPDNAPYISLDFECVSVLRDLIKLCTAAVEQHPEMAEDDHAVIALEDL